MKSIASFFRLVDRPVWTLFFVLSVVLVLGTLPAELGDPGGLASAWDGWRNAIASPSLASALWRSTILVSLVVALFTRSVIAGAQTSPLSWSLPAFRSRVLAGALPWLLCPVLVAAGALAHAYGLATGFAAAGVAMLVIGVVWELFSPPALQRLFPSTIVIAIVVVVARPAMVEAPVQAHPLLVGLIALAFGLALLLESASARPAREIPLDGATSAARGKSSDGHRASAPSYAPLEYGHMRDAFRAMTFSVGRAGRLGLPWFLAACLAAMIMSVGVYSIGATMFMAETVVILSLPTLRGAVGQFTYPLSRTQRAQLSFWGNCAWALLLTVATGMLTKVLFIVQPWPQLPHAGLHTPQAGVLPAACILFALAPLSQWSASRLPLLDKLDPKFFGARGAVIMLSGIAAFGMTAFSIAAYPATTLGWSPFACAALIGAVAFVTHASFYLLLRRTYAIQSLI